MLHNIKLPLQKFSMENILNAHPSTSVVIKNLFNESSAFLLRSSKLLSLFSLIHNFHHYYSPRFSPFQHSAGNISFCLVGKKMKKSVIVLIFTLKPCSLLISSVIEGKAETIPIGDMQSPSQ